MKRVPSQFKKSVFVLMVLSATTSAYANTPVPAPAGSSNDVGCPNTATKTGVYAPCVGYIAPGATSAVGVHHLSVIPGVVVQSMTTGQAAAKGLLPGALGTPSFGVMVAVSEGGGAGQQNSNSQPSVPPLPSCAYGYQYIHYNPPTWTGWDVLGWNPGSWSYACNPPPQSQSQSQSQPSPLICQGGYCLWPNGSLTDGNGKVVSGFSAAVTAAGDIVIIKSLSNGTTQTVETFIGVNAGIKNGLIYINHSVTSVSGDAGIPNASQITSNVANNGVLCQGSYCLQPDGTITGPSGVLPGYSGTVTAAHNIAIKQSLPDGTTQTVETFTGVNARYDAHGGIAIASAPTGVSGGLDVPNASQITWNITLNDQVLCQGAYCLQSNGTITGLGGAVISGYSGAATIAGDLVIKQSLPDGTTQTVETFTGVHAVNSANGIILTSAPTSISGSTGIFNASQIILNITNPDTGKTTTFMSTSIAIGGGYSLRLFTNTDPNLPSTSGTLCDASGNCVPASVSGNQVSATIGNSTITADLVTNNSGGSSSGASGVTHVIKTTYDPKTGQTTTTDVTSATSTPTQSSGGATSSGH